jgi:hypothetical protein
MYQNLLSLASIETLILKRVLKHPTRQKTVKTGAVLVMFHKRAFLVQHSWLCFGLLFTQLELPLPSRGFLRSWQEYSERFPKTLAS